MRCSVVIPTHNRWTILKQTLPAVVTQTLPAYEIIVIDDGSQDETPQNLPRLFPNIKYLRQYNRGPASARNLGLATAKGEIIAFTDDDCLPPSDWLLKLTDGFRRHPQVVGVGGALLATPDLRRINILARYEEYCVRVRAHAADTEIVAGFECPAGGTNNMSYLRTALQSIGGFDPDFPYAAGEDADLKFRLAREGAQFLYTPVVVTHLQSYTWTAFRRQQYVRGKGNIYFDKKWRGQPTRTKILLRSISGLWRWSQEWMHLEDKRLAGPALVELWQNLRGQWAALGEIEQ